MLGINNKLFMWSESNQQCPRVSTGWLSLDIVVKIESSKLFLVVILGLSAISAIALKKINKHDERNVFTHA